MSFSYPVLLCCQRLDLLSAAAVRCIIVILLLLGEARRALDATDWSHAAHVPGHEQPQRRRYACVPIHGIDLVKAAFASRHAGRGRGDIGRGGRRR